MLYQPQPKFKISRIIAALKARFAGAATDRADRVYLDRVPPRALEDLGIRRAGDGSYKLY